MQDGPYRPCTGTCPQCVLHGLDKERCGNCQHYIEYREMSNVHGMYGKCLLTGEKHDCLDSCPDSLHWKQSTLVQHPWITTGNVWDQFNPFAEVS